MTDTNLLPDRYTRAMNIALRPVTISNRGDLDEIHLGEERFWLHSNWYWHQQSLERASVQFRLVHLAGEECAVGLVAFGPCFLDETLLQVVPGVYELIHLGIDHRFRGRGIGKRVAQVVIGMLQAEPDCAEIVIAHHQDNHGSRAFFIGLGFKPIERRNYDGDPMLSLKMG